MPSSAQKESGSTRLELELAIVRIEKRRPKVLSAQNCRMNISCVAKEAGVTPAAIHNTYPDIAEKIRSLAGKSTRAQRNEKHDELQQEKKSNRNLRDDLAVMATNLTRIASENARLLSENAELKAIVLSENVILLKAKQRD